MLYSKSAHKTWSVGGWINQFYPWSPCTHTTSTQNHGLDLKLDVSFARLCGLWFYFLEFFFVFFFFFFFISCVKVKHIIRAYKFISICIIYMYSHYHFSLLLSATPAYIHSRLHMMLIWYLNIVWYFRRHYLCVCMTFTWMKKN